jgi:hypothetical protein
MSKRDAFDCLARIEALLQELHQSTQLIWWVKIEIDRIYSRQFGLWCMMGMFEKLEMTR